MGSLNKVGRVARLGKIYRLIKMFKLARLIKTVKIKEKMTDHMSERLKIDAGLQRAFLLLLTFVILQHVTASLW